MSSLLLFLLLGSAPDQPVTGASAVPARAQAVASARILDGQAIAFGQPVDQDRARETGNGGTLFPLAPIRTTARWKSADGQIIELQEFP